MDPQGQLEPHAPQAAHSDAAAKAVATTLPASKGAGAAYSVEWRHIAIAIAAVLAIHLLPRLLLGDNSYVTIHDNIESDLSYRVLAARDHRFLASHAVVTELVGGLPRWDYPSPYKLGSVLFWLLPPFWAYVTLELLVSAIAVLGMALLLKDYVRPTREQCLLIAATFGILPFYYVYDLTVAGEPLIAWALLNLWHDRHTKASLAACAAYPFAAVLWTGSPFFILMCGVAVGVAALRARRIPWLAGVGLFLIGIGFLIADRPYLAGLLRAEFVSTRSAWHTTAPTLSLFQLPKDSMSLFLRGRFHAASLHTPILVATLCAAPLLWRRGFRREAGVLMAVVALGALLAMSGSMQLLKVLLPIWTWFPFLRQVNLRFWWSLPLLWYTGLGLLALYWTRANLPDWALNGLLLFQFAWVFAAPNMVSPLPAEPELRKAYVGLVQHMLGKRTSDMSWSEFLSTPVFDKIREHIGNKDTGRFLSIGLHTGIAALNGFQCADGIHDNYPLAYKNRFHKLIAGELAYDKKNRAYFEDYGTRAYVLLRNFKSINRRPSKPPVSIHELDLNEAALHDLGVKWILSAVRLKDKARLPFFIDHGVFSDPSAAYTIQLYRVRDAR